MLNYDRLSRGYSTRSRGDPQRAQGIRQFDAKLFKACTSIGPLTNAIVAGIACVSRGENTAELLDESTTRTSNARQRSSDIMHHRGAAGPR